ncbi:unannotated protein [freshwater metagenome]|uniref:Unannotated protein n=1 Tax=freshwater metagenome TaxID=449393 RepID=A0A6J6EEY3_9ZZZZ
MPQVQRIRNVTNKGERTTRENSRDAETRLSRIQGQNENRSNNGNERDPSRKRDFAGEQNGTSEDQTKPNEPEDVAGPATAEPQGGEQGEQRARSKFPHSGEQHKVGPGRVDACEPDRQGERHNRDHHDGADHKRPTLRRRELGSQSKSGEQEQRPHYVELFFHGERPVVLGDGASRAGEVIDRSGGQVPVLPIEGTRSNVPQRFMQVGEGHHESGQYGRDRQNKE